jgi:LPXTG-site transpeptidase (sortase) family protein
MSEKRSKNNSGELIPTDQEEQYLQEEEPQLKPRRKKAKKDYGKTIRWLYGAAIVLAVAACVMIVIKTYDDLSAEKSAESLMQAYKDLPTATPNENPVVMGMATPDPAITPDPSDAEANAHRVNDGSDEGVDESANYVPPEEPETNKTNELIQQIVNTVGDDGVIGVISIPKFDQEYPIIGKWSYKLLKISICRYQGPGVNEAGNLVLMGHNYKSGAHFGNLKSIEVGDEVFLQSSLDGPKVRYEVYDIEVVEPNAFSALDSYKGECGLTLMTCTNSGNSRRIVRCVQKAASSET